ncbi:MAG: alanine racemase, partial [Solirubrobacteraceae bacterium]|nr:alanine racemase [Solirubrobacteraceae bacterium]
MTDPLADLPIRCLDHLQALADQPAPLAYVDLDAFEANAASLLSQAGTLPIRVASKSLRCTTLIQHALGLHPRVQGAMAFTVREALHLAEQGVNDVLIAYPSVDAGALADLAEFLRDHPDQVVRPMVDDLAQVTLIAAAANGANIEMPVCVDVDTAWRPFGGRGPAIGARRSPLREPEQVAAFVAQATATPGVRIDGL